MPVLALMALLAAAPLPKALSYLTAWRRQADGRWKIFHNASLP